MSDDQLGELPYLRPDEASAEARYLKGRRESLGGYVPARYAQVESLQIPPLSALEGQLKGTGDRSISTTMAFVRILSTLLKDPNIGKLVVPIVPDESRTFGMESLFRQIGIHSHVGQLYIPQDAGTLSYYKESADGRSCRRA